MSTDMQFEAEIASNAEPLEHEKLSTRQEIRKISSNVRELLETQDKFSRQLTQVLRENVNFQNQVRQGMYHELELLKEQLRGEQFTPLLKEVAAVCVEYRRLLAEESLSDNARRTLQLMFDQLEDILADYGAELSVSNVGEVRRPLLTKIINTISTGEQSMHNTVAKSRRPGVVRNGYPLYREYVDVYVFDPSLSATRSELVRTE